MKNPQNTALIEEHKVLNAEIVDFAGWNLPLYYSGILEEHKWCRENTAIFDTSHMGEFILEGDLLTSNIDSAVTQQVSTIPEGSGKYGFILNESGGIIDDQIIFRISADKIMIVVNAARSNIDFEIISQRLENSMLQDVSNKISKLDVQGPNSQEVLSEVLGFDEKLKYFGCTGFSYKGNDLFISRTGYTGEHGYEIYSKQDIVCDIWKKFIAHPFVKPAGLGARDLLRLEMGYSLYGTDIDEETSPYEAGLGMFVDMNRKFIGQQGLFQSIEKGLAKKKISFKTSSRRAPRHGYNIVKDGRNIGYVTSGVFSPILGSGIGMGYVDTEDYAVETFLLVSKNESIKIDAQRAELPFYKNGSAQK